MGSGELMEAVIGGGVGRGVDVWRVTY